MRICRILTNNALVVLDEKGKEQIVCGKGIGYKKRPGDNVDDKLVETVYVKEGDQSFEQIRRTLEALPEEYLLLAQHIVEAANVSLNMKINPVMAVSLADHLSRKYHYQLLEEERMYLTIHIRLVVNKGSKMPLEKTPEKGGQNS